MSFFVPVNIESLEPYVPGTPAADVKRQHGLESVYKLASNENALGASPVALAAAAEALGEVHRYPDPNGFLLKHALAEKLGVAPGELVLGSGSAELIGLLVRAFVAPGSSDEVVFGTPSFPVYGLETQMHGARPVAVPLGADFRYDTKALLGRVTDKTRLLFLANPNNPTGTYLPAEGLEALVEETPPPVVLVIDEAYFEYAVASDYRSALALRSRRENLVVLRTFSKAYGLAGLRVGYAWAPETLCNYLDRVRPTFNVNQVAQAAAVAALGDEAHLEKTRAHNRAALERLRSGLSALGFRIWPSQTNFVLVDVASTQKTAGWTGEELYAHLLPHGVIVRPVGKGSLVRITAGLPAENERVLEGLASLQERDPAASVRGAR